MILKIKNLSKKFGNKVLFDSVDFIMHKGERVALIGPNGSGKTTLIRCIAGEEDFEGMIDVTKNIKISIMEQEKEFENSEQTYSEYLEEKRKRIENLKKKYEEEIGDPSIYEDTEKFTEILKKYEILCARITEKIEESRIKKILHEINFEMESYNKRIIDLSGGQRTKLRLSECLCKNADLIILDEPTNHLDFDTLKWLEEHIVNSDKAFLIVSHDRYFLNKVLHRVIEIENKDLQKYNCGYEKYVKEKVKHLKELEHHFKDITKKKKKLLASAKEKRRWASISRDRRFRVKADNLERQAENLPDVVDTRKLVQKFKLNFEKGIRSGTVVFSLKNVKKSFDGLTVFDNVSFDLDSGDKITVIGKNGSGKSTLLKLLFQSISPDSGTVTQGYNLNIGYFDQELKDMNLNQKVIDFFRKLSPKSQEHDIISTAIKFGFPKDKLKNKISSLSGGEKARLNFVRLMTKKCNVLLLDEPTNNLDMEIIEVLEKSLKEYKGTIVFVSHDRYFIDKIATKIIVIDNKNVKICNGNYSDNFN